MEQMWFRTVFKKKHQKASSSFNLLQNPATATQLGGVKHPPASFNLHQIPQLTSMGVISLGLGADNSNTYAEPDSVLYYCSTVISMGSELNASGIPTKMSFSRRVSKIRRDLTPSSYKQHKSCNSNNAYATKNSHYYTTMNGSLTLAHGSADAEHGVHLSATKEELLEREINAPIAIRSSSQMSAGDIALEPKSYILADEELAAKTSRGIPSQMTQTHRQKLRAIVELINAGKYLLVKACMKSGCWNSKTN